MLDKETRDLLPDLIRNAMDALNENTNTPDELSLPVTLAVATFATQGLYDAYPIQWAHCPLSNFYCVLVPSGGLKTTIMDACLEGAKRFEEDQRQTAEEAWTLFEVEQKRYDKKVKDRATQNDPIQMGITTTPQDKILRPKYPRTARYMLSKFTLNGLLDTLKGVPHAALFNSDAAEFFNSHSFSDETKAVEIVSAMSRLWSGETVDKVTGMEDVVTRGKRTTALFMLQQELAGFLTNSQFKDQGFTNRMLITQCDLISKKRADFSIAGRSQILKNDEIIKPFNDRIYELLTLVDKRQQIPTDGLIKMKINLLRDEGKFDQNILTLPKLSYDDDGSLKVLEDFYNELLDKENDEDYKEYTNFMARAYEHCVRIVSVLATFELRDTITVKDAKCGVGLMRYFINQRLNLNIDGVVKNDPIVECCESIVRFLKRRQQQGITEPVTRKVLNNFGPSQYRKMNHTVRAKVLEELMMRETVEWSTDGGNHLILAK